MSIGMQINHQTEGSNNMEELIICQNRIKDALLHLIEKERKFQTPELINNFNKWSLYNKNLLLHPKKSPIITSIYRLHNALELEETSELEEITQHVKNLRVLANE